MFRSRSPRIQGMRSAIPRSPSDHVLVAHRVRRSQDLLEPWADADYSNIGLDMPARAGGRQRPTILCDAHGRVWRVASTETSARAGLRDRGTRRKKRTVRVGGVALGLAVALVLVISASISMPEVRKFGHKSAAGSRALASSVHPSSQPAGAMNSVEAKPAVEESINFGGVSVQVSEVSGQHAQITRTKTTSN